MAFFMLCRVISTGVKRSGEISEIKEISPAGRNDKRNRNNGTCTVTENFSEVKFQLHRYRLLNARFFSIQVV